MSCFLDTGLGRDGYCHRRPGPHRRDRGREERRSAVRSLRRPAGIATLPLPQERGRAPPGRRRGKSGTPAGHPGRAGKPGGPPGNRRAKRPPQFLDTELRRARSLEVTLWVDGVRRAKETVRDPAAHSTRPPRRTTTALCARDRSQYDARDRTGPARRSQRLMVEAERVPTPPSAAVTEEQAGSESRLAVLKTSIEHSNAARSRLPLERSWSARGRGHGAASPPETAAHRAGHGGAGTPGWPNWRPRPPDGRNC